MPSLADAAFGYAPGKVILLGEHAVVYGQPAIAATLDRGVRVAVASIAGDEAKSRGPVLKGAGLGIETDARPDPDGEGPEALRRALAKLVDICGERARDLSFVVEGRIPAGAGMGSSAALSVAMLRGVRRFLGESVPESQIMNEAYELERVFHGNPSGVDHSVIAHGGLVCFQRGESSAENRVEPISVPRRLRLAIGLAGAHAGTASAVAALRDRARRHPDQYEHIYRGIGDLAEAGRRCLIDGHLAALGELMDLNQGYLNALGVSTPAIESLCSMARERGALGAKLTGAGGGGAVIALMDDNPEPVVQAFESAGFRAFASEIHADSAEAASTP